MTPLMETDSRVQYAPSLRRGELGTLLYLRGGSLLVQPFDADRLQIAGEPIPILQNVALCRPKCPSVLLSFPTTASWSIKRVGLFSELKWYDRAGRAVGTVVVSSPICWYFANFAPTAGRWQRQCGTRIMDGQIFGCSMQTGGKAVGSTYPPASHMRSVWSSDGERVAFAASRTGPPRLTSVERSAGGKEQELLNRQSIGQVARLNQIQVPTIWSRDGPFHRVRHRVGGRRTRVVAGRDG